MNAYIGIKNQDNKRCTMELSVVYHTNELLRKRAIVSVFGENFLILPPNPARPEKLH